MEFSEQFTVTQRCFFEVLPDWSTCNLLAVKASEGEVRSLSSGAFDMSRFASGDMAPVAHNRLGVLICDDVGGVARPSRAVRVRLSR